MLKQGFIPARRGQDLLYLDYDGVLHTDAVFRSRTRGIYLAQLEQAIRSKGWDLSPLEITWVFDCLKAQL